MNEFKGKGKESGLLVTVPDCLPEGEFTTIRAERFVKFLLDQPWHRKCEFIFNYLPPYPGKEDVARHDAGFGKLMIRYNDGTEYPPFLRFSNGPKQGFFWDIYGEDFQDIELAILALAQAPAPVNVNPITFTIPLAKRDEGVK